MKSINQFKKCRDICNRRLQHCEEALSGLDREIGLFESWLKEANQLKTDTEHGEVLFVKKTRALFALELVVALSRNFLFLL